MQDLSFRDLDQLEAFRRLSEKPEADLAALLTEERIETCETDAGGGLRFNYAAAPVDDETLSLCGSLTEEAQLIGKYRALLRGEEMNTGEGRKVLHHLARGEQEGPVTENGHDIGEFYRRQQQRIADFARKVRSGEIRGSTGKPFDTVVQIGIGGSDLGPRALYLALEGFFAGNPAGTPPETSAGASENRHTMTARFISNVDPDDAAAVLGEIDPERSLFILVSKSGTTQETLTNRELVLHTMRSRGGEGIDPSRHMVAVTSSSSPLAQSTEFLDSFFIDDYIGGRYSSTSAVGGAVLSLAFGPDVFEELLQGAEAADRTALEENIRKNAALLDAVIGIYYRNVLHMPATAVLPYSQALSRFPAHLQQLDMESNGKQVNREGRPLSYSTGPVVFGEPGTNGQHSFYQLLHQGTDRLPLQFIGFRRNQRGLDLEREGYTSRAKLNANLAAQIIAFARGTHNENRNKHFPGLRPSTLLHGEELSPRSLGALLAHFENKVMFQGFLWNLNSFDQEGVQLGKVLTKEVLGGAPEDPALKRYARMLGVL
jgi:glucose-6-phosphate isomerase